MNVSVAEAKAKFSDLVKRAEGGEEIAVTRHGKVVARLVPPHDEPKETTSLNGAMAGKIWIADDFDELGPEWDEYTR
jgi:prevent-host-death family protein